MNSTKILFFLFISFLLVSASINGVQINPKEAPNLLCAGKSSLFVDIIKNNDNAVKSYNLALKGNSASWATITANSLILIPGEEKTVYIYVTPPETIKFGDYTIDLEVSSQDRKENIKHSFQVVICHGASLVTQNVGLETCPNRVVNYPVEVTNIGESSDKFDLEVEGDILNFITLSEKTISLEKGKSKTIFVYVNAPVEAGEYYFNLNARSQDRNTEQNLPLFLRVTPCYNYNVNIEQNTWSICDHSYVVSPITIKNDGTVENNYDIVFDGPIWGRYENVDLTLKEDESKTFNLVFAPDYGVYGNYTAHLEIIPSVGNVNAFSNYDIEVRKCNSVDIELPQESIGVCEAKENIIPALIKNDGEIDKIYNISIDAPNWVTLSNNFVELQSGEEASIILTAIPPADSEYDSYSLKVKAFATDDSSIVANDKDSMILNINKIEECFKPSLEVPFSEYLVYPSSFIIVPINVFNGGFSDVDYNLYLSGTAANFAELSTNKLSLESNNNKTVYLAIAPGESVALGDYYADVELYIENGPFLEAKTIRIFLENSDSGTEENKLTSILKRTGYLIKNLFSKNEEVTETEVLEEAEPEENISTVELEPENNKIKDILVSYKWYIVAGLSILFLIILISKITKKRKSSKYSKKIKRKN